MAMNIPSFFFFLTAVMSQQVTCDVDKDWMRKTLSERFSAPRHHVTNPVYKNAAMTFISDQFREMGLETHFHNFSTLVANVTGVNVIGLLKGRYFNTQDDSVVGVAAHYDTVRETPGVNDNGAAVVVMLQAARELSKQAVRNATILFIGFDMEEGEFTNQLDACITSVCGSRALVKEWLPDFLPSRDTWNGLFNMDIILNFDDSQQTQILPPSSKYFPDVEQDVQSDGNRGDFLLIAGRQYDAPLVTLFNDTWNTLGETHYEIEAIVLPSPVAKTSTPNRVAYISDVFRSDHANFWANDYRAVFITDTGDFRGYMRQCYHHSCDNLTYVNDAKMGFIAKTARTLISVVDIMAPVCDGTAIQSTNHFVILPALLFFRFASF